MDRLVYSVVKAWRRFKRAAYWLISAPHMKNWRTEVMKSTFFRFPPPVASGRDKRAKVPKIGKMFYEHKFPSWVIWNKDDPNSLYINVDMLGVLISRQLNLRGIDDVVGTVAWELGSALLRPKVGDKVEIKVWTKNSSPLDINPEVWLSPDGIKQLENF